MSSPDFIWMLTRLQVARPRSDPVETERARDQAEASEGALDTAATAAGAAEVTSDLDPLPLLSQQPVTAPDTRPLERCDYGMAQSM